MILEEIVTLHSHLTENEIWVVLLDHLNEFAVLFELLICGWLSGSVWKHAALLI